MRKGLNSLTDKQRRAVRRTNHFSLDRDRDHKTRVIPNKRKDYDFDDYDWYVDDEYHWLKERGLTSKE